MESTKLSALLVLAAMLALASSPLALAWEKAEPECNSCQTGTPSAGTPATGVTLPPVTVPQLPSLPVPSVPLPSLPLPPIISKPPVSLPPVLGGGSPVTVPPVLGGGSPAVTVPPVLGGGSPAVTVPPVLGIPLPIPPVTGLPPVTLPPVLGGGSGSPAHSSPKVRHGGRKACPPPPSPPTPTPSPAPPSDTCPIDALKLGVCVDLLGNDVHIGDANVQCCALVKGVAGLSAAACLCTAIKAKVLDLSLYVPIALKLLVNCGCAVPPGYTCA